jgi:hypothetical protein
VRRSRLILVVLTTQVLGLGAVTGVAHARWTFVGVFAEGANTPRVFVDHDGALRWSAVGFRYVRQRGGHTLPGAPHALVRSRSATAHLSPVARLASRNPTVAFDARGGGLVAYTRNGVSPGLHARRRSQSGRELSPERLVSQRDRKAVMTGAGVDERANSVITWTRGTSPGIYARRMSGRGTLGPVETISATAIPANVLSVAPNGRAVIAFVESTVMADGRRVFELKAATAGPTSHFGLTRTVATETTGNPPGPFENGPRSAAAAIANSGVVTVAWVHGGEFCDCVDAEYIHSDVLAATASPGQPFGAPQQLAFHTAQDAFPVVAFSPAGAGLVTWQENQAQQPAADDTILAALAAPGGTFRVAAVDRRRGVAHPVGAFDDRGDVVVAWERQSLPGARGLPGPTASLLRPGGRFGPPTTLSPGRQHIRQLSLSGGGRGRIAVTWTRLRDGNRFVRESVESALWTP